MKKNKYVYRQGLALKSNVGAKSFGEVEIVMANINMRKLFIGLQNEMLSTLEVGRELITHNGEMGEAAEESWRKWLRDYLPKRYRVDKAFVIDCDGSTSDQIDIVIYDGQYSYFVFKHEQAIYVPAESVYAVIEVKQDITKQNLEYAGDKARSVRALKRTSAEIPFAAGKYRPKPLHDILAGIIAIESNWSDPLGETLKKNIRALPDEQRLDFGCALKQGAFWVEYAPDFKMKKSAKEESLMFFFLQLLMKLQAIGTVPAIEIREYAKSLQSFEE